jgi:Glycosyltransferases involved in cell wall biogenesis
MAIRTEQEIMKNWKYDGPPLVSVVCITYNHEPYIRDAIEGFLMQETDFPFEIIIHDDASTDRTAEIVREYQVEFSNLIKPIYQKENQYSKGIKTSTIAMSKAVGEFIALCEGDDYWISNTKLQIQANYLRANSDCTFTFHNGYVIKSNKKRFIKPVIPWRPENSIFSSTENKSYNAGELQLLGFIPTASFFFPKKTIDSPPLWYFEAPVGDNAIKLLATSQGYAYYMKEKMCIYRTEVFSSATNKWFFDGKDKEIKRSYKFIQMLDGFNIYTNGRYLTYIEVAKIPWNIQAINFDYKKNHKTESFKAFLHCLPLQSKIKYYLHIFFPSFFIFLRKARQIISSSFICYM